MRKHGKTLTQRSVAANDLDATTRSKSPVTSAPPARVMSGEKVTHCDTTSMIDLDTSEDGMHRTKSVAGQDEYNHDQWASDNSSSFLSDDQREQPSAFRRAREQDESDAAQKLLCLSLPAAPQTWNSVSLFSHDSSGATSGRCNTWRKSGLYDI
mmetsp:Transcript_13925/g.35921  ORF Transcript_13925/g.35921 Transcript_13925/m.35921 type:complete len:154 (+) Transcript_13925:3-464(+)